MIEWLETYFAKENIAIYGDPRPFLLERVCNEIIELDNGKLYSYKGNYII
jgi:ATP-binding cassette subfamily F protein uup